MISAILKSLSEHAGRYALAYVAAAGYALLAALTAFIEIFTALTKEQAAGLAWWQVLALIAKFVVPGLAAILAFMNQSLSKISHVQTLTPPKQ